MKNNLLVFNGIIDSDYTGLISYKVINMGTEIFIATSPIAQIVPTACGGHQLDPTSVRVVKRKRGDDGFGSSDKIEAVMPNKRPPLRQQKYICRDCKDYWHPLCGRKPKDFPSDATVLNESDVECDYCTGWK